MGYTPTLKCGDIVELPIFIKNQPMKTINILA